MSKVVVVGAGKTGRGFLGRLLAEAGKEILFIDKDEELVRRLNEAGEFQVDFFGNVREPQKVTNYQACTWAEAELEDAELILVSVGGQNLTETGECLKDLLAAERHYYIITAENASHPSITLRKAIGRKNISVSESTVFCTTIEKDGLDINSENYPYLQCDGDLLEGYVPPVKQIRPLKEFSNFLTRKLYTYNAASCVIAYLGWLAGYTNYADAANDEEILKLLDQNYEATNRVLCQEFGYEKEDQEEFAALSKKKFCDRTIVDTVERNARDPRRKLAAGERIMGPLRLLRKYGEDSSVLEKTVAAAILYEDRNRDSWEGLLTQICNVQPDEALYADILGYVQKYTDEQ